MSGQLVGEVLAASDELRSGGLSERGFHALIAIAEKCDARSRQGSVRWDHIRCGLYGASQSTAKRAVADLQAAGVIRLVKRGFNNQNGRSCAPIYEVGRLTERVTQMTHSPSSEQVTLVTQSPLSERVKPAERTAQIEGRSAHPDDLLDGSIDGSIDGGVRTRASKRQQQPLSALPNWQCNTGPGAHGPFGPRCRLHVNHPDPPNCRGCRTARETAAAAKLDAEVRRATEHVQTQTAIEQCSDCDEYGWLLGDDRRVVDPARRCAHAASTKHTPTSHVQPAERNHHDERTGHRNFAV